MFVTSNILSYSIAFLITVLDIIFLVTKSIYTILLMVFIPEEWLNIIGMLTLVQSKR